MSKEIEMYCIECMGITNGFSVTKRKSGEVAYYYCPLCRDELYTFGWSCSCEPKKSELTNIGDPVIDVVDFNIF